MRALDVMNALKAVLLDPDNRLGGSLLGTYTYDFGLVDPAIAVGNPPNDIQIEGLECIIPLFPDIRSEWTTASIHRQETWDITLIQREAEGSPTLPAAIHRLSQFFTTAEGVYTPQDDILGSYPQYRLTFTSHDLHPILNRVLV